MSKEVIIVGAGPGGLASALLLAYAGFRVRVIERLPHVGGRTSVFKQDGYRFDLGPTFFLFPRILREIFASIGRDLDKEVELVRLDPQYRLIFGAGGQMDATADPSRMQAEIARLNPYDAGGFVQFLNDNRIKLDRFETVLTSPFDRFRDLLRPDVLKSLAYLRPWRTLDREVKRFFTDPRVRLAFTFQGKYVGMSPFQCPSLFSILAFLEYEHGVFHPMGGCGAVSNRMAEIARSMGVEFSMNEPVVELVTRGRRVVGIRTEKSTYTADAVVLNADFARSMQRLVPDHLRKRWSDRSLARKKYSCSTFMMYLGLDGHCDIAHHTVYLADDYKQNIADIERNHRLPEDPSIYVQNPCVTDPSMAPAGRSAIYVLAPVTHQHDNVNWAEQKQAFRQRVLTQLEKVGISDVRRRIRYERVITPADWDNGYQIYRGATFNLAHSLRQMLLWRPHNRFEELDGLYLVGGGTHPGSGLPVIYSSARIATQQIKDDLGVPADRSHQDINAGVTDTETVFDRRDSMRLPREPCEAIADESESISP